MINFLKRNFLGILLLWLVFMLATTIVCFGQIRPGVYQRQRIISTGGGADTQSPTVPTSLASSSITQTGFTLSWTASTDNIAVTGYDIFRNGLNTLTIAGTSASITGLDAGTSYSFQVRARDAAGNVSALSSALSVTTSASETQPTLEAAWLMNFGNSGNTSVTNYNNLLPTSFPVVSGTSYPDLKKDDGSASTVGFELTSAISGGGGSGGSCTGSTPYQAAARNSWWRVQHNEIWTAKFKNLNNNKVYRLYFFANSGTNASISIFTINGVSKTLSAQNNCSNTVSFIDITPLNGEIEFRLSRNSGYFEAGLNVLELQQWSSGIPPDNTNPSVPTSLIASNILGSSFTLQWTASTDNVAVTGYDIYKDGTLYAGNVSGTTYNITGLNVNTTYSMTVRARDAASNVSAQSSAINVTTANTGGEQVIVVDTNLVTYRQGMALYANSSKLFDGQLNFSNSIADNTRFIPNERGGDWANYAFKDFISGSYQTTGAIVDIDLGQVTQINALATYFTQGNTGGSMRMYVGFDWIAEPTDWREIRNYNSTPFFTSTGTTQNNWVRNNITPVVTRYIKIVFDNNNDVPDGLAIIGEYQGTPYSPPAAIATRLYTAEDAIGALGNEGDGESSALTTFGMDGGWWRSFSASTWIRQGVISIDQGRTPDGSVRLRPAESGSQDDYIKYYLDIKRKNTKLAQAYWLSSHENTGEYFNEHRPMPVGTNPYLINSFKNWGEYHYVLGGVFGNLTTTIGNLNYLNSSNSGIPLTLDIDGVNEDWNEPDKVWKQEDSHFTPMMVALMRMATINAFNGRISGKVGFKTFADKPGIRFSLASNSRANMNDYYKVPIQLAKSYNPGIVNSLDINIHHYSNVEFGNGLGGLGSGGGISPERDKEEQRMQEHINYRNRYLKYGEVHRGEFGYDNATGSVMGLNQIGTLSPERVRSGYATRTIILNLKVGTRSMIWHMAKTNTPGSNQTFETSGLWRDGPDLDPSAAEYRPRITYETWWAIHTLKYAGWRKKFNRELNTGVTNMRGLVFRDTVTATQEMAALWFQTENDTRQNNYVLTLPAGTTNAKLIVQNEGTLGGTQTNLTITGNQVTIPVVSETPVYVVYNAGTLTMAKYYQKLTLQAGWFSGGDAANMANEQGNVGNPAYNDFSVLPSVSAGNSWTTGTAVLDLQSVREPHDLQLFGSDNATGTITIETSTDGTNYTTRTTTAYPCYVQGNRWTFFTFERGTTFRYLRMTGFKVAELSVTLNAQ